MDLKITVKKITQYKDLMKEYENEIEHTCDLKVGMTFVSKNGRKPKGFCESAWSVIRPFAKVLANGGGNFYDGWMKNEKSCMISCNDGFRPVSFYIETIDEEK